MGSVANVLTLWMKHGLTSNIPSSSFSMDTETSVSTSLKRTRRNESLTLTQAAHEDHNLRDSYLDGECPSNCNDQVLATISVVTGNIKRNNVNAVDKACINDVFLGHSSYGFDGRRVRIAGITVKLLYLTASTEAVAPGIDTQGDGPSARIEVDMNGPAIGGHRIVKVVLQIPNVLCRCECDKSSIRCMT